MEQASAGAQTPLKPATDRARSADVALIAAGGGRLGQSGFSAGASIFPVKGEAKVWIGSEEKAWRLLI